MKRTPVLVDVHGTPLRESLGYTGGGIGFGGQMADWMPPAESVDAALLPSLRLGNARADDLVRNNGIAANAVALHKDHIVGHLFLISYRPNWRYLGMRESAAKSFVDEVEAAWTEYCDGIFGEMDAEGKRTFTEFIREGVGVHAFNGEIFLQPVWDAETTQVFRTRFKAVSPKRVDTPGYARGNRQLRAGVETDRNGKALAYHVCDDDWPVAGGERWTRIPRFLPSGRPAMLHIFEPVEDGQTRGANQFYSVMERLKMLDTLQATQLQSAIVKAMYAATIESELDSEKAFEYITAADNKDTPLVNMLANYARYYSTNSIKLGGVKIPHLYPGDELNLQTAQDSDNGFSALEQALLRYIAAGLGVSYEQLSRDYSQVSYSSARASANESWRYFLGRRRFIAGRLATQMFSCWLEEALIRGVIRAPRARFSFWEARSSWSRSEWIGAGRMAIDGLKEVQESVMRIEAGLSTYEKELAIMGEDYQEIFRQQVRESEERRAAGLSRPVWITDTYQQQIAANSQGQQGYPASIQFSISAPAAPSFIELTPGYFQITATPRQAVYDPTVQYEFWFSDAQITDIHQVENAARYLGTALYWIAASVNIRPGRDYYFYIRGVNQVGKSAFVEATGQASNDAAGYLDFFKGQITESHLGKELLEKVELTEDNASKLQQFSKEWQDANDKWNAMWGVKIEQTKDGKYYVAGLGLSMEDTPDGKISQFLVAADRIAYINPANGNETPGFVMQGDQIIMNEAFLKYLSAPTITSGGNPPAFSLTPDGRLTAKNADISGHINAISGALNNVVIAEDCTIQGTLRAERILGDIVKAVGKEFPYFREPSTGEKRYASGTLTVQIDDDQSFDRQIIIPPINFQGSYYGRSDTWDTCTLEVRRNGALIYSGTSSSMPESYGATLDMPAGGGIVTLTFSVSTRGNSTGWPNSRISDLILMVVKKSTAGIRIS
ncbi:TPA: phage portal protein [Salmonella enterica subsp. enterica serovar Javiana]|nr:phage portal protein [Salmonella enterica subsp. enterica serovar Javiana]